MTSALADMLPVGSRAQTATVRPGTPGPLAGTADTFAVKLAGNAQETSIQREVRTAAREFVAIGLVQPLFALMRNDPFKSDLFHGGQGEEMFGPMLDQHLASRIVGGSDEGLEGQAGGTAGIEGHDMAGDIAQAIYRQVMSAIRSRTSPGTDDGGLDTHG